MINISNITYVSSCKYFIFSHNDKHMEPLIRIKNQGVFITRFTKDQCITEGYCFSLKTIKLIKFKLALTQLLSENNIRQ